MADRVGGVNHQGGSYVRSPWDDAVLSAGHAHSQLNFTGVQSGEYV